MEYNVCYAFIYNILSYLCVSFRNLLPPHCKQIRTNTIQSLSDQCYSEYQGNNRTIRKKNSHTEINQEAPTDFNGFLSD